MSQARGEIAEAEHNHEKEVKHVMDACKQAVNKGDMEMTRMKQQLETANRDHTAEIERLTAAHSADVENIRFAHATELERLHTEHRAAMDQHAAALGIEHRRRLDEQKAELESMASSLISLQDELQRARAETEAVRMILEADVTSLKSKHELDLKDLRSWHESQSNEMAHQHAEEIASRDASVSDAEDVLMKKEEKIEQLEEQVFCSFLFGFLADFTNGCTHGTISVPGTLDLKS